MSQFRKTGTYYVSQWGGDSLNAGTDPNLPLAHPSDVGSTSLVMIVGAGYYSGGWVSNHVKNLFSDGKVIIDAPGFSYDCEGFRADGIHFKNFTQCNNPGRNHFINDCIFENCANIALSTSGNGWGYGHLFIGDGIITYNTNPRLFHSIILGKQTNTTYLNRGSYNFFDKNSRFCIVSSVNIFNNCFNCEIVIGGVSYEAKKLIDGSPRPDANPAIPDVINAFPNFYNQGNHSCEDPKFIDFISRTVEADSPLLLLKSENRFIGSVKVGKAIAVDQTGFIITKTGIDDSNPNSWKLSGSFGKVRISGKVSDSLISAQTLDIRIPFNFDGSEAGGSAGNNNVPDAWNARTTLDTKGTLPNRLTFEVRSSKLANADRNNSADWDNDNENNPSIAGQYYLMEYGQAMLFHVVASVAYGNADANAINAPVKQPFNYRSLDIIITITDTRVI